jgi:hypothetical protein
MSMISIEDHNQVSAVFKAEIDRLKAEIKALRSGDVYTPCNHKFNASFEGVLSCTNCRVPFFEQQERGES